MKNRLVILIISICALICCVFALGGCGSCGSNDNTDPKIKEVYNSYVVYTLDKGGTPLSYDEWLKSIKGEKGDKGDDGLSAYELYKKYHPDYTKTEQEFLNDLVNFRLGEDENLQGLDFYLRDDGTYSVAVGNAKELSNIVIPSTYKGKAVTKIVNEAFKNCLILKSIVIPDNVKSIGKEAFYNCASLKSVIISDGLESIGRDAFYNCPIENATMPTVAISQISKTNLKTVVITSGESIGFNEFAECEVLQSAVIKDGVTVIGDSAFYNCEALQSIVIGNGIESIGDYAFHKCTSLQNVSYNGTIEQWGAISKGFNWKSNAPFTVVHCTDGDADV